MDCTNIIGEKIKSLRTNQEISIQELAERAGLTVEQVSRIEENIDIPSLAPLIKIARALGVRLGTFLDDQTSEAGPVICRKGEADDTGSPDKPGGLSIQLCKSEKKEFYIRYSS